MFGHWIVFYDLYCTVLYWVYLLVDISNVGMCMVWVTQSSHHMKLVIMCFCDVIQEGSNRLYIYIYIYVYVYIYIYIYIYTVDMGFRNAYAR